MNISDDFTVLHFHASFEVMWMAESQNKYIPEVKLPPFPLMFGGRAANWRRLHPAKKIP